jgi:alanine racemase
MEVDVNAVRCNADRLAERAGVPLIAVLKADAYGAGAVRIALALRDAPGIWGLAIATAEEGLLLRDAGIAARLLCCTPVVPDDFDRLRDADITPSLSRRDDIARWCDAGGDASARAWHLSVDTGMSRAGVPWDEVGALRDVLAAHRPQGAFTHFAATELVDATRDTQEARFMHAVRAAGIDDGRVLLHVDNSLGIAARGIAARQNVSPYHLARPGIALYGCLNATDLALEPAVRVRARVIDVREVGAREGVSYGPTWRAPTPRRVATLSIGYADGYRRAFSNRAHTVINGTRCAVLGTVTMDMTMVDVTDARCAVGDVATLVDAQVGLDVETVAAFGDLSPYELLVGFKLRLARVYSDGARSMALEQDL